MNANVSEKNFDNLIIRSIENQPNTSAYQLELSGKITKHSFATEKIIMKVEFIKLINPRTKTISENSLKKFKTPNHYYRAAKFGALTYKNPQST